MRFTGGVEFREGGTATHAADARRARRRRSRWPSTAGGAAERATFTGDARFEDGTLHATAAEARYLIADDRLVLAGTDRARRRRA